MRPWRSLVPVLALACVDARAASVADPLPEPFPDTEASKAFAATDELEDLYMTGQIAEVARQGMVLIRAGDPKPDPELRLKIALSLSAQQRQKEAIEQLKIVVDSEDRATAREAQIPLANAYRWSGRPDMALPHFVQAAIDNPKNQDAQDGVTAMDRELRPRTTAQWTGVRDNGGLRVQQLSVAHRWRGEDMARVYEVETHGGSYEFKDVGPHARPKGVTLRHERTDLPLEPKGSVTWDARPLSGLLGELRLKMTDWLTLSAARDNWGAVSLAPRALEAGMTANRLTADGLFLTAAGVFSGRLSYNRVSDGNRVTTSTFKYAPALPFGGGVVKPYVFVDTRSVGFNTPNYWSPAAGVGIYGLGSTFEWVNKDWYFIAAAQYGDRWFGDAGKSWVASATVQRWINERTAVSANWFGLSSIRDGARYRSHLLSLKLDWLW